MIKDYFTQLFKQNFHFSPTFEQEQAIRKLTDFLFSSSADRTFILRGYAGTGKTSIIGAFVTTLQQVNHKCLLLAPTGRAAKVFSHYANHPTYTIHKKIYRQKTFSNDIDNFRLNDNLHHDTLFIVDEASMIANEGLSRTPFGSGCLLDDLVHFVYGGQRCQLIMVGDDAQLPPIGERQSPALDANALRGYGLETDETTLSEVVRQKRQSGILWNATRLRQYVSHGPDSGFPIIHVTGFADIRVVHGTELIESISSCYDKDGIDNSIVICRSNKRTLLYNNGIRSRILYREELLESGDMLMVAKNNYFWAKNHNDIEFIANGDVALVQRVRHERELYGFHFADVTLRFPDYNDCELETTLLLDTLQSDAPALTTSMSQALFERILADYADITTRREQMKKLKTDPYYNALQVKYGYAVTCHKAQGGQWENVFIDQGYMTDDMLTPDYFRWLYTAFTRATQTLYLVNWPEGQAI
ncbi:MAG: AAA family ATPase [Bacteroidales bacterium]|nr:AAA family ATPase [Bacteroidales bacterium]